MNLSVKNYPYESWGEYYDNNKVDLTDLDFDPSWEDAVLSEFEKPYFKKIEKYLSHCLKVTSGEAKIYPYPELVFNALYHTPLDKVKVVILGQDPYHNCEFHKDTRVPQAMGLSFSIPKGIKVPSSLLNIYKNQLKFGHINELPKHGNLVSWAKQGVLMINTSLTVQHSIANSHAKYWLPFTDHLIEYISENLQDVVFVLWGAPALKKLDLIDQKKHKIQISSHPSGLSYNKSLRHYKPFIQYDHFGEINQHLKSIGKKPIRWKIR